MRVEKRLMVLSLVPEPTRRIIQHLKDSLDTLALKGLSSANNAQPEHEEKLQKRAYPATNLKSARTVIPTNFYADEQIRGEPQKEKRKWTTTRAYEFVHELLRGWN